MKILKIILWIAVVPAVLYLVGAGALVFWPKDDPFAGARAEYEAWAARETAKGGNQAMDVPHRETSIEARDGVRLFMRRYGDDAARDVVVFVHGIASESARLNNAAGHFAAATGALIVTPDVRGHGKSGGPRADVSYVGQYEDDLEDTVRALAAEAPGRRIFIAGHSMGGGIALRYSLAGNAPRPAGFILFAPSLGDAPTLRRSPDPNADPALAIEHFIHFDVGRFVGLWLFNQIGIHLFDGLEVMHFNYPPEYPAYTFRAVLSGHPNAPKDSAIAFQSVKEPLLVMVGEKDEPFIAEAYEPFVSANSDGVTILMPSLTHNGLINAPETFEEVRRWFARL